MKTTKTTKLVTLGEGERALELEVLCNADSEPETVAIDGKAWAAEELERVAAALEELRAGARYETTGGRTRDLKVCADHGYFEAAVYRCPVCNPNDKTEAKPAQKSAARAAPAHVSDHQA